MKKYIIENYGKKSTFASFLPGISGVHGVPIWCFYVNRGQGVVSFGVNDKENSIMEFYPAHQAYQNVKTTGFRTFVKVNGRVYEPFSDEDLPASMEIAMNLLELEERNAESGLNTRVSYFTLPNEPIGGLVRTVTVTNTLDKPVDLELLDGMPALIPYGVNLSRMKEIGQTAKAWMQVEDAERKIPYYRTKASLADTAAVEIIETGNFALGFHPDGSLMPVIVDPALVFSYDTAMRKPVGFADCSLKELLKKEQVTTNELPCAFFALDRVLQSGESVTLYELYGQADSKPSLHAYLDKEVRTEAYFSAKRQQAIDLTENIGSRVETKTASQTFDAYCAYNYMDNVLRGGYPVQLSKSKVFYTFSRKHGDLERDYNFFAMLPEYYSQGNGHFRDVNQNRRCDTFLAPFVQRENIKKFYSLIQLDGYSPLNIEKMTYELKPEDAHRLLQGEAETLREFVSCKPFTPGALYRKLEELLPKDQVEDTFRAVMEASEGVINDCFGDGYWSDHWTYNLDLVEDYLEVYPDREEELLYGEDLLCFLSQVNINDRKKRYVETKNGLRQYRALNEDTRRTSEEKFVRMKMQQGDYLKMSLLEKLVLMCAAKFAALDAYGMGVEMEGGKPGWYDALNGLPGMFGSSMNEAYELCRMLDFTVGMLKKHGKALPVLAETADFLMELNRINHEEQSAIHSCDDTNEGKVVRSSGQMLFFWNRINDAKEHYRNLTYQGIDGKKVQMKAAELACILGGFADTVRSGIHKAKVLSDGIIPAYFAYDVPEYQVTEEGIEPRKFVPVETPHFLEGAVRYLKLHDRVEEKRRIYQTVKDSDLYDAPLKMYKINASLSSASYELGRAVAFTPGWLENESIWLHMEYKYLLELLRSGLYEEFFGDFHHAAVPFLNPEVYGRSVYENSSFLASSRFPNPAVHGKGFVARLSGSTIEFISMWKLMMFGAHVLRMQGDKLCFTPEPALPKYLIPEDGVVSATLFGTVKVSYHFAEQKDYIPGQYQIFSMRFLYADAAVAECPGGCATDGIGEDLRSGRIQSASIEIC